MTQECPHSSLILLTLTAVSCNGVASLPNNDTHYVYDIYSLQDIGNLLQRETWWDWAVTSMERSLNEHCHPSQLCNSLCIAMIAVVRITEIFVP